jgi:hypothetical protein
MNKNDGLKINNKNYDSLSIKSSVIKDFINTKDNSLETKSSFFPNLTASDQMSSITKLTIKTSSSLAKDNFFKMNQTNKTEGFRRVNKKFDNNSTYTSTGFFNKTSDKLIFNSLTIND